MNTNESPVISVIIPCYNAARWIRTTLQSVYMQQGVDFEVVVVDDGSSDNSAGIVEKEFPQVRLIRTANGGPSRARNLGTRAAQGTYIQYLDADDLLAPGKLAAQVQALEQSGADVAYGDWQRLVEQPGGDFVAGQVVERELPAEADIALFTDFWCPPAAYLFRRSIVERIGSWNEGLPVIQDARFALDAALQGGRFVYCPGVMALYREHHGPSVSRRDPVAFHRDVYRNALEVEAWWLDHGGLTELRRNTLIQVYGYVAYVSFDIDATLFTESYAAVMRLSAGKPPAHLRRLALARRLFGTHSARRIVGRARFVKRLARSWGRPRLQMHRSSQ